MEESAVWTSYRLTPPRQRRNELARHEGSKAPRQNNNRTQPPTPLSPTTARELGGRCRCRCRPPPPPVAPVAPSHERDDLSLSSSSPPPPETSRDRRRRRRAGAAPQRSMRRHDDNNNNNVVVVVHRQHRDDRRCRCCRAC